MRRKDAQTVRAPAGRARTPPPGWTCPGGFTLIELLVVISIISLLVAMLMPTLAAARKIARQGICATRQAGIGRALWMYANANGQAPYVPLGGRGWGVAIGTGRDVQPGTKVAQDRNPASCLYLLVREGFCSGKIMVCPATGEKPEGGGQSGWDFNDGTEVSYALMNPYGPVARFTLDAAPDVPILADASPYFDPATGLRNAATVVDWAGDDQEEMMLKGNSPNHNGEGQNVAWVDGSARWEKRADVGRDKDSIYTRADDPEGTDREGSIPAPGADGSADDQGPAGPSDSYLLP